MIRSKDFYKSFFSLYIVLVLQNIIILSVNLADNIMIGGYSEISLSGVAAVNQVQFVFQHFIMGCADALVVIGSQYWGQERTKEIKLISFAAFLTCSLAGAMLFLFAWFAPNKIISLFTSSPQIINQGVEYIKIIKYTYVVFAVTNILLATLRTVETVKIAFLISLSTLMVNCSINFVLIEGRFGFPELGVTGAAIGTLTARIIELIAVVLYILIADKKLGIRFKEYLRLDKDLAKDYLKTAWPIVMVSTMFGLSTALQTVILGHMSDNAIAANSVSTSLYQTLKVIAIGGSSAASILMGKAVGAGNMKTIREYTKTFQVIFFVMACVMSSLLFVLKTPILSFYDLSPETKHLANAFILVLCITGFGTAYEMPTLTGIIRGGGDGAFILKLDIISIWMIVLPLSYLAAFKFGWSPIAVVFCLNLDQLFKCVPAFIKANSYTWIKKLTK